jgi:GPH family glycoside/pentoside/hexuronide:cation symporter
MQSVEPAAVSERTPPAPEPSARLAIGLKLAYGMPAFAGAAMAVPIAVHMTKFYSDTVGVALGFIALAQALARVFDAITDPLMGWISDRTNTRWGRRRPWIFVGAPIAVIFFVMLFAPPSDLDPPRAVAWFTISIFGFFVLNTIYGIPHYGLGPELTSDYQERNSLFAYREGCILLGTMLAAAIPSIAIGQLKQEGMSQADAERQVYRVFAVICSALMVLLYWWMCYRVPENPEYYKRKPNPLIPGVRRVLRNRPFRILLACYLITSLTGAIPGIFMPYYLQYVLGLENWSEHLGGGLLTYFGAGFLSDALVPVYVVLAWAGAAFGCGFVVGPSIQADVIDYDELYTGKRREAQYGALWAIAAKFAVIPSASIALSIMAAAGFEPNVAQTETVRWTIRAIYGLAPASMLVIGLCVAVFFPINERIHREVIAGIRAHREGRMALDPLTGRELPPPADRGIDEETGWYLDHFSRRELRRAVAQGHGVLARDARLGVAFSALACGAFSWYTVHALSDLSVQPGPDVVLSVIGAGIGLTGLCFHAVRVRAARLAAAVPDHDIRAHVASTDRFAQDG